MQLSAFLAQNRATQVEIERFSRILTPPGEKGEKMKKPNLLFIYTDEQRYNTMRAYGNTVIDMPNLNRFSETATVCDRAYVTQPVCTPSRASLLTGLTPHTCDMPHNNLMLPEQVQCLPEMLNDPDYVCAHHGKWHLGDEIYPQHGFGQWRATEDSYHAFYRRDRDQADRSPFHEFLIANGRKPENPPENLPPEIGYRFFRNQIGRLPEELSRPKFLSEGASRFIKENQDDPFVLYVNFLEPHMPFFSPRDDQYSPDHITLPDNFGDNLDENAPRRLRRTAEKFKNSGYGIDRPLATEEQWRRLIARYWGMCSLVDTHAGKILDTLTECGLDDNTVVVFTSDHGDMMGSHNLLGKGYMFEESTRIPLLVRLPGQKKQNRISGPVSQLDLVPTLLESMGKEPPSHLEGKSRLSWFENGHGGSTGDIFIEWHGKGVGRQPEPYIPGIKEGNSQPKKPIDPVDAESIRTVVTEDLWKLNLSSIGDHELYDLNSDPGECRNIISDTGHRERVTDMIAGINSWQKNTGDTADWCTPESVFAGPTE